MDQTKSAFVAIVGKPNVGKSSLLNQFIGEKVAIVSNKPQTTRTKITGVLTKDQTQYVFIDTPGLHKAKNKLSEFMVKQITQSVSDVDIAVLVTEATGEIFKSERELMESFQESGLPAILAVNKIDILAQKDLMMNKIAAFMEKFAFSAVVPISARTGDGVDLLLDEISKFAVESVHFFDDDTLTDQPERVIAAEIIREKILNAMRDEIPHGIAVSIESMKERPDKPIIDMEATIFCERDSHKGMVIGKNGEMLKRIATTARVEIESFLDTKVNLQCWVKVKEDWRNSESMVRQFGFK